MTTNTRYNFDSGNGNDFWVHIGDNIVKFTANGDGIYLSKSCNILKESG